MFYFGILSCYVSYSLVHLSILPSFLVLPPLSSCLTRLSLSFSYFQISLTPALIFPSHSPGALISTSPHLSISLSLASHRQPALLCFPATPLYHHHHVHAEGAHCSTVEHELYKENTDNLLSCKNHYQAVSSLLASSVFG